MRTLALALLVMALAAVCQVDADASELGTAGPFRSLGGHPCLTNTNDGRLPSPVDPLLPRAQQAARHIERARVLLDLLRVSDARIALGEALELEPDNVQALMLRGRLSLTEGDPDVARLDLEHASRIAPDDPDILASLAAVSPSREALRDLDSALTAKPDDVDILFLRARTRLSLSDVSGALTDLDRDVSIVPDDIRARLLRAQVHLHYGAYDLALVDAEKVLSLCGDRHQALEIEAAAYAGKGDEAQAINAYSEILDGVQRTDLIRMPEFHNAMVARGRLYAKQRRFPEARKDLDRLIDVGTLQSLLRIQLYLRDHGYPNVEISGHHTMAFDAALDACFKDVVCGPNMFQ